MPDQLKAAERLGLHYNANTRKNGLLGIFSGRTSVGYRLVALTLSGEVVADFTYCERGHNYEIARKDFGDQLELRGYNRFGF